MFEILTLELTPFAQNTRIIFDRASGDSVVIDPGGDYAKIAQSLDSYATKPTQIWLTHSHLDHCGAVRQLQQASGAKLYAHPIERELRARVVEICMFYGIPPGEMQSCPEPDVPISGGETLALGEDKFKVLFTPGHSPGHLCFYNAATGTLIAGDTLFAGSIGRTDLPGGDHATLLHSIRQQLLVLPDDTRVLCGHGPDTTIGRERKSNPILN